MDTRSEYLKYTFIRYMTTPKVWDLFPKENKTYKTRFSVRYVDVGASVFEMSFNPMPLDLELFLESYWYLLVNCPWNGVNILVNLRSEPSLAQPESTQHLNNK